MNGALFPALMGGSTGLPYPVSELVTVARAYYVDVALGSDTNNGLSAGAGAFKTIQHALNEIAKLSVPQGYTVTLNVAAGDYTAEGLINLFSPQGGFVSIVGDYTTPSNCKLWAVQNYTRAEMATLIGGFEMNANNATHIYATNGSVIRIVGKMRYLATAGAHVSANWNSNVTIVADEEIVGGGSTHWSTGLGGTIDVATAAVIDCLSGSFAFTQFISCNASRFYCAGGATFLNHASVTGKYYTLANGSICDCTGRAESVLPGNAAGTADGFSSHFS